MSDRVAAAAKVIDTEHIKSMRNMRLPNPSHMARALDAAGLLAPELPDPSVTRADPEHIEYYEHNHPDLQAPDVWDIPELSSYYLQAIGVFPGRRSVQPWADGEPEEPVTPEEARAIAYYWLAAADYAEKEEQQ